MSPTLSCQDRKGSVSWKQVQTSLHCWSWVSYQEFTQTNNHVVHLLPQRTCKQSAQCIKTAELKARHAEASGLYICKGCPDMRLPVHKAQRQLGVEHSPSNSGAGLSKRTAMELHISQQLGAGLQLPCILFIPNQFACSWGCTCHLFTAASHDHETSSFL